MEIFAVSVTPPAYSLRNRLKAAKLAVLTALFGCQHPNPTIPFADSQECPDCGMVRDYVFSLTWRNEYRTILSQWQDGQLTCEEFARNFHERLERANAVFIGEWRTPKSLNHANVLAVEAPISRCLECGRVLFANGKCPTGDMERHIELARRLEAGHHAIAEVREGGF